MSYSIRTGMAAVVVVALCLVALRNAEPALAQGINMAALSGLFASFLGCISERNARRAFWLGFATFGWGYLLVYQLYGSSNEQLVTSTIFEWMFAFFEDSLPIREQSNRRLMRISERIGPFVSICHSLFTISFGVLGGIIARYLYISESQNKNHF